MRERAISAVPKSALLLLACGLALQLAWHKLVPPTHGGAQQLGPAPGLASLRVASVGEPIAFAKLLMFYVQAVDSRIGAGDYARVEEWLTVVSDLDPKAQYPLLAASHLYAEVQDEAKKRRMLDFVYQRFLLDPNGRWRALAHVTLVAKHQLHDLPLALRYARAIRLSATGPQVPGWARQMEIFVLEDMQELDSAKILIGGLLSSGQITDPHELRFLQARLTEMTNRKAPK